MPASPYRRTAFASSTKLSKPSVGNLSVSFQWESHKTTLRFYFTAANGQRLIVATSQEFKYSRA